MSEELYENAIDRIAVACIKDDCEATFSEIVKLIVDGYRKHKLQTAILRGQVKVLREACVHLRNGRHRGQTYDSYVDDLIYATAPKGDVE